MEQYFIFKKDLKTGKTVLVCDGSHDTAEECSIHWQSYMYGFMDGMFELDDIYGLHACMREGEHERSFLLECEGEARCEYFALFGEEGHRLVLEIA